MNFFCVFQINFFEFLAEISSLSKENLNFLGKNYGSSSFSDFDWKILSVKSLGRASNHHFAWPGEHVEEKFCFRATFIYHTFRTSSEFSSVFCQKNSPRCQNCILLVQRVFFGGKTDFFPYKKHGLHFLRTSREWKTNFQLLTKNFQKG